MYSRPSAYSRFSDLGAIGRLFAPFVARYDPDFIFKRDNPTYKTNPTFAELAANPDIGSPVTVDSSGPSHGPNVTASSTGTRRPTSRP